MSKKLSLASLSRRVAGLFAVLCFATTVNAQVVSCGTCDSYHEKCPPPYKHCYEGPPRIHFKHGCPKPVCDPCHLPHYGYFRPCWRKWPWAPNWSHCYCPPPGALVPASVGREPVLPEPDEEKEGSGTNQDEIAPRPRPTTKLDTHHPLPVGPLVAKTSDVPPGGQETSSVIKPTPPKSTEQVAPTLKKEEHPKSTTNTQVVPAIQVIGSRAVILNVARETLGPVIPGETRIELWYTRDGRQWYRDEMVAKQGPPFEVEVQSDGSYGFIVRAQNEVGRRQPPPKPGDAPQIWVEIDTRQPVVQLSSVHPITSPYGRAVKVQWTALDRNMAKQPITIAWSTSPRGPWTAAMTNVDNTGQAIWQIPGNVPPRFYVQVEAHDTAGNVGVAKSAHPVILPVSTVGR